MHCMLPALTGLQAFPKGDLASVSIAIDCRIRMPLIGALKLFEEKSTKTL